MTTAATHTQSTAPLIPVRMNSLPRFVKEILSYLDKVFGLKAQYAVEEQGFNNAVIAAYQARFGVGTEPAPVDGLDSGLTEKIVETAQQEIKPVQGQQNPAQSIDFALHSLVANYGLVVDEVKGFNGPNDQKLTQLKESLQTIDKDTEIKPDNQPVYDQVIELRARQLLGKLDYAAEDGDAKTSKAREFCKLIEMTAPAAIRNEFMRDIHNRILEILSDEAKLQGEQKDKLELAKDLYFAVGLKTNPVVVAPPSVQPADEDEAEEVVESQTPTSATLFSIKVQNPIATVDSVSPVNPAVTTDMVAVSDTAAITDSISPALTSTPVDSIAPAVLVVTTDMVAVSDTAAITDSISPALTSTPVDSIAPAVLVATTDMVAVSDTAAITDSISPALTSTPVDLLAPATLTAITDGTAAQGTNATISVTSIQDPVGPLALLNSSQQYIATMGSVAPGNWSVNLMAAIPHLLSAIVGNTTTSDSSARIGSIN